MITIDIKKFKNLVDSLADANEIYRETFGLSSDKEAYPGIDKLAQHLSRGYEPTIADFVKVYQYVPHMVK